MPDDAVFLSHPPSVATPNARVSKASNGIGGKSKSQKSRIAGLPNAKMGAPSVLSESQRRKLARLYVYTNMKLPDICTVLSLKHKEVKPRTVHNILRKMLQERYNLLRPKDTATRKLRVFQVKGLCRLALARRVECSKVEPSVTKSSYSDLHTPRAHGKTACSSSRVDTTTNCVGEEALLLQEMNDYTDWIQENVSWTPPWDLKTSSSIRKTGTVFDEKSYNDEEGSIESSMAHPLLTSSTDGTAPIKNTDRSSTQKSHGGYFEVIGGSPDQTWIEPSDRPSRHHTRTSITNEMETSGLHMMEQTNSDLEPLRVHEPLLHGRCSGQRSPDLPLASVQDHNHKKRSWNDAISEGKDILTLNRPLRKLEVRLPHTSKVMSGTEGTSADGEESTCSDLSRAINRFSAYSDSQKRDIKDMITVFSEATISESDETTSAPSHPSDVQYAITDDYPDKYLATLDDGDPAFGAQFDLPSQTRPFETSKSWQEPVLRVIRNLKHSLEPLLSSSLPDRRLVGFPDGGCSKFRIPRAGVGGQELLAELHVGGRLDWKDQCGNTVLHYAAALGADYDTLSTLIERVSRVNEVNTAGETFMHVIQKLRVSWDVALVNDLDRHSFDYQHRDHKGQIAFHALASALLLLRKLTQIHEERDASGAFVDGNHSAALLPVPKFMDHTDSEQSVRGTFEWYQSMRYDTGLNGSLYSVIESQHVSGDQLIPCCVLGFIECDPRSAEFGKCPSNFPVSTVKDKHGRNFSYPFTIRSFQLEL